MPVSIVFVSMLCVFSCKKHDTVSPQPYSDTTKTKTVPTHPSDTVKTSKGTTQTTKTGTTATHTDSTKTGSGVTQTIPDTHHSGTIKNDTTKNTVAYPDSLKH